HSVNTRTENKDSYNTDESVRNVDSYNTENRDSYNTSNETRTYNDDSTTVLTSMDLEANVSNVSIHAEGGTNKSETGSIRFDNGAFTNFAGIQTSSTNTGLGSANQAATAVGANANVTFGDI